MKSQKNKIDALESVEQKEARIMRRRQAVDKIHGLACNARDIALALAEMSRHEVYVAMESDDHFIGLGNALESVSKEISKFWYHHAIAAGRDDP